MTANDLLMLCYMSYIDLPPLYSAILKNGGRVPVRVLADYVLREGDECVSLNEYAREAARELLRSRVYIAGYINENDGGGFVAYVLEEDETIIIAMRGSERAGRCVDSNVDWADNICEPFAGSVQLEAIRALTERFQDGEVIFTGHSKGGHNALLALSISENPKARAYAFNGQGFGRGALDDRQKIKLKERGVNYVVADDLVGALLLHPEKRIYVKQREGTNAHMPEAFLFDGEGRPILGRRTLKSQLIEAATRIADMRIDGTARTGIQAICRAALNGRHMDSAAQG